MDTQVFEVGSQTSGRDRLECRLATVFCLTAATTAAYSTLTLALLGEVRELVRTQQELLALGSVAMTLHVGRIDIVLDGTRLNSCEETTLLLYLEEDLPALHGQTVGEVLHIIRACTWVNHRIEVTFLLQQQLLVTGDTL